MWGKTDPKCDGRRGSKEGEGQGVDGSIYSRCASAIHLRKAVNILVKGSAALNKPYSEFRRSHRSQQARTRTTEEISSQPSNHFC